MSTRFVEIVAKRLYRNWPRPSAVRYPACRGRIRFTNYRANLPKLTSRFDMNRRNSKIRIDDDGRLEVVDPGFDSLELLRAVDPDFRVRHTRLPSFVSP